MTTFSADFSLGISDISTVFSYVLHHLWVLADFAATIHHYQVSEDSFCEEKCSKRMANRSQTKRSISAHTATVWHFACVQIVAIYLMIALHRAAPTVLSTLYQLHLLQAREEVPTSSCTALHQWAVRHLQVSDPGEGCTQQSKVDLSHYLQFTSISRQLTAGRMIHDTHTIDVFAHFCNTDVQLCRAQNFREKCGEWNQYLEQ